MFAVFAQFLNIFILTYGQPIFGPRMENDYQFPVAAIGATYAIPCVTYALTGPIFLQKVAKNFEFRTTIMIGFIIIFTGGILIGPSSILHFPEKSAAMMIVGISILGIGEAFTIVPIIPEMIDSIEHNENAHDKVSALFSIAGGFGQIVAPLLSGWLTDKAGFNLSLDVCAIIVISFFIAYFVN